MPAHQLRRNHETGPALDGLPFQGVVAVRGPDPVRALQDPEGDFFGRLLTGHHVLDLSRYMFDTRIPRYLRALSLFHVVLPVLLVWMTHRLGYDRRAWAAQTLLALIVLPLTYAITDPAENINWVHGLGSKPQTWLPPSAYLAMLMALFPIVVYLPTHILLLRFLRGT